MKKEELKERDRLMEQLAESYLEEKGQMMGHDVIDEIAGQLRKRLYEKILEGEMDRELGYGKKEKRPEDQENRRNGYSKKRVLCGDREVELSVPRDRNGDFDPIVIAKHQRRLPQFDDKVLSMYGRGMTQREIQGHLEEIYGVAVSAELISAVTDRVLEDVRQWQSRPLDKLYPIVYFDALMCKVRQEGKVERCAVYVALGINLEGQKEVLGVWLGTQEGAKFWLGIFTELNNRGVEDIFIACVDGLCGLSEAIESIFPLTKVQSCIVHAVRNSLKYVNWKERKEVAQDLRKIYSSPTLESAEAELENFCKKWDKSYPIIGDQWRRNWEKLSVLFEYPPQIRKAIYTTNAIESLNHSLRRVLKIRKAFSTESGLFKVLYLALDRASRKWTQPIPNWGSALQYFRIEYSDRIEKHLKNV